MKKIAIIFLISLYAFITSGITVKADYCCNNLKSVKFTLADYAKDKEGCCKVKYQSFKIKDAHAAADILNAPVLHYTFIHSLNSSFYTNDLFSEKNNRLVNSHAPPLNSSIPVYISNCVFRI